MSNDLIDGLVDRLCRLLDQPDDDEPVLRHGAPEELLAELDALVDTMPNEATDPTALLDALDVVIDRSVRTASARFVNQNFAGPDPVAVLGDALGAALNTTAATYEVAPMFTLLEASVLHELARRAGYVHQPFAGAADARLPPGIMCPGGSTATLYALQLARHRLDPDIVANGASEPLALFVSASGHYSATKCAALLGIGTDGVVSVETDHNGAMDVDALRGAVNQAQTDGRRPLAVIATAGTTVTAAFDDIEAIAEVSDQHDLWLHVDGCYGGSALFSRAEAGRLAGVHRSDSMVWNLHKMLGLTQQCTALLVREPDRLASCFAVGADYLFQPDKLHGDYDTGDRTFQCARRVDALKLWLSWQARGSDGFEQRIDHAVALARHTRDRIDSSDGAFVAVAGDFTNVVFAWVPPHLRPRTAADITDDADTTAAVHHLPPRIKARMQREGTALVGFQPVHGVNLFRLLYMNPAVTTADVDAILSLIDAYGTELTEPDT